MKTKNLYITIFLSVFAISTATAFSQTQKAARLYNEGQYANAIQAYKKIIKKHPDNGIAAYNLANTYRILTDYDNAKQYYALAIKSNNVPDSVHLYYGQLLKITGNTTEAASQFGEFVDKHPNSLLGKLLLSSCKSVTAWNKANHPSAQVSAIAAINSKYSDFSPLIIGDKLVFTSNRNKDMVNDILSNATDQSYFSLYSIDVNQLSNADAKIKSFSNQLKSIYSVGPAVFCTKTNQLFFDKAVSGKSNKKTLGLFISEKKGKKWEKAKAFTWNSGKYSIMHPAISSDGKTLYFASDMPGGQGGYDIWKSEYQNNSWTKPINVKAVNTPLNEVFPTVYDNTLYFSSNGQKGYGGLDVFRYQPFADAGKQIVNMKAPFNSPYDDFGVFFTSDSSGYLSSNRSDGKGKDDIYTFKLSPEQRQHEQKGRTSISGVFQYKNLPSTGIKVNLMSADDKLINSTQTDNKGRFKFSQLNPDSNYLIVLDEKDANIPDNVKLYFTNNKGQKVLLANKLSRRMFAFKPLPVDEYNKLPIINETDEQLLTVPLAGQVYKTLPGDFNHKIQVFVIDDKGNIIAQTYTGEKGKFNFEKLPPDQRYLIKLKTDDGSLKVIILNNQGKLLSATKNKGQETFQYTRLGSDKNLIHLLNEKDQIITISADENFTISNIYYDYDKYNLNSDAKAQLDKLAVIMKKNPQIKILLKSYTDSRGGDNYNLNLSQKRANTAVQYIESKGISASRLTGKGLGEADPVNGCVDGVPCTEAQYAKNRRTDVQIIATKK